MQSTTVQELRQLCKQRLEIVYDLREAQNITDWLLEERLGYSHRNELVLNAKVIVSNSCFNQIASDLVELETHKPIQHVLGKTYFYGLQLVVNDQVLIPRPETEELVALIEQKNKLSAPRILDIGTGSGAIPLALKSLINGGHIVGVDVSKTALEVAKQNAKSLGLDVLFSELDILDTSAWKTLNGFDIIVSNPPYIPLKEKAKLDKHVIEFEPRLALFSPDDDPALFYKTILLFATEKLNEKGLLYFELNPDLAKEVLNFALENGFEARLELDMQERERFLIANKKNEFRR